jgi:DnaJ-domain-containing protein 1
MIDLNHALAEVLAATGQTEEAERAFVRTLEEAWSCMESDDQKLRAMTESYLAFLDKLGRTEDAAAERARFAALAGGVHPA